MKQTSLFSLMTMLVCGIAQAQPFSITNFSIEGSGGTSQGGSFSVTGIAGEAGTGPMNGGGFAFSGGWQIEVATTPDEFQLRISFDRASERLTLSWPTAAAGYVLQVNSDLGDTDGWMDVATPSATVDGNLEVTVQPQLQRQFYRLRKSVLR